MSEKRKLIRSAELLRKVPLSRPTIYRRMAANKFPKPIKITEKAIAWDEAEIDAWLEQQAAQRAA